MSVEPYAERLIKERDELKLKTDKLTVFLDSDKIKNFNEEDLKMLRTQLIYMSSYLMILNLRIGRYEEGRV
ncbi:MAG: hypothetical protein Tp118SUR00d2C21406351_45 [Prokaryotic dsDNA virus sp.]|nr:MAG: hypothetical protein Tp118SUR00d2C21406351_45 [Prokaryotic dsDNA virus sp.]|tara:strand:+ start:794 stop:1006 length:213 start_codon:yes stop_codon:yes gene_type:complete